VAVFTKPDRISSLDFMRGFAVIVMVMGHSIDAVLSQSVRATEAFRLYDAVRGFTAPMFLFISGFAFAVVALRRWNDYAAFGAMTRKRITRLLWLLALGYALHFPFFSLNKILHDTRPEEYAMMFQVDILHCLVTTMLVLHVLMVVTRTPERFLKAIAGLGVGIVVLGPLVWQVDFTPLVSPFFAPYFNQKVPSIFPLFPFGAYLCAGTATGLLFVRARAAQPAFLKALAGTAAAVGLTGLVLDILPFTLYPAHDFWKVSPNFFMIRIGVIGLITAGFFSVRRIPEPFASNLVALGQGSLLVYAVHLVLVYGSAANSGLMQFIGQRLAPLEALAVACAVLALMVTTLRSWSALRESHYWKLKIAQAGFTSSLLYFFLTKPF
jgi:acyltransferase